MVWDRLDFVTFLMENKDWSLTRSREFMEKLYGKQKKMTYNEIVATLVDKSIFF